MRAGRRNLITDVAGLRVGQAHDPVLRSGVTVLLGDAPFTAGVCVMGGAPGTRETDLLRPEPVKPGYLSPDVEVLGFEAFKRVCAICCDDPECSEHARDEMRRADA